MEVHGKHNKQDDMGRNIPEDFALVLMVKMDPRGSDLASAVPRSLRLYKQTSRLKETPARAVDDSQRWRPSQEFTQVSEEEQDSGCLAITARAEQNLSVPLKLLMETAPLWKKLSNIAGRFWLPSGVFFPHVTELNWWFTCWTYCRGRRGNNKEVKSDMETLIKINI